MIRCRSLLLVLLLFWTMPVLAAENTDATLESISFHQDADKAEVVRFKLSGNEPPSISMIKGDNPRIILDYANTRCAPAANRSFDTKGILTKKIRVGIHNEGALTTRVVVDLARKGGSSTYTHSFDAESNTLVLRVFSTLPTPDRDATAETASSTPTATAETAPAETDKKPSADKAALKEKEAKQAAQRKLAKASAAAKAKPDRKDQTEKATPEAEQQAPAALLASASPAAPPQAEAAAPTKTAEKNTEAPPADTTGPAHAAKTAEHPSAPTAADTSAKTAKQEKASDGKQGKDAATTAPPAAKKPEPPLLRAVTFDKNSVQGEMVIFKLNGFYPPKVTGSEKGAPQVICDFSEISLSPDLKELIPANGRFVTSIQISKPKKSKAVRAILNLVPNRSYDLQQVFYKEDNLFVLVVRAQDTQEKSPASP